MRVTVEEFKAFYDRWQRDKTWEEWLEYNTDQDECKLLPDGSYELEGVLAIYWVSIQGCNSGDEMNQRINGVLGAFNFIAQVEKNMKEHGDPCNRYYDPKKVGRTNKSGEK